MEHTMFNYTTIIAPVAFFLGGIILVMGLNKFIGQGKKKSD